MKAYCEYDAISQVSTEKIHEVSYDNYNTPKTPHKSYNSFYFRSQHNSNQFNRNQGKPQYSHASSKPKGYNCKGEHLVKECKKLKQDKAKYKLKTANIIQKYMNKIIQKARKDHISINEATFSSNQQESTYSVE